MSFTLLAILALLFLIVGALYVSVGHAGASGYLAVMALLAVDPLVMRPTALAINILVAAIAFVQFTRAQHFSWKLFWPFAITSVPAAFLGAIIPVPTHWMKCAIGIVLMLTAFRMAWFVLRPLAPTAATRRPRMGVAMGCGGVVGAVSGITGTGGGIFLSPILLIFRWADTKRAAATSALFILVNSLAALGGLASNGWKPAPWLIILAAAACVGGVIGATYGSRHATPRALNVVLALVLCLAGAKLVWG